MELANKIIAYINNDSGNKYGTRYALRKDKRDYNNGAELPCSHDWIDGDMQDTLLSGTCAIKLCVDAVNDLTVDDKQAINAALGQVSQYQGNLYLVKGRMVDYGQDANEIILQDCSVIIKL